MNAIPDLPVDSATLAQFMDAAFRYAAPDTFMSIRAFYDDRSEVFFSYGRQVGDDLAAHGPAITELATRCARVSRPVVFCPPLATFTGPDHATEGALANGLVLSVECDSRPTIARGTLERLLGPATVVTASGGEWLDPGTGEVQDKSHLHWRLNEPTTTADEHRRLKHARALATALVGGDATNKPVVHPIRWPGSWHRKGSPRLARIVTLTECEVGLGDALDRLGDALSAAGLLLGAAAPAGPSRTPPNGAEGSGDGRAMSALVQQVLIGEDYHGPLVALAMRYLKAGMVDGQVVETLRGHMLAVPALLRDTKDGTYQPGRWQSRYDDIPRAVSTARAKLGEASKPILPTAPERGFLARTRLPAPALPLEAFGPWWARWIEQAAAGANAPPDYVAAPLLAAASALIGNARWARGWHGWFEPPALWCASVGNPSSGKSPGAAPVMREVLALVEAHMARDYPDELAAWKEASKVAELIEKQWEKDVAAAVKAGGDMPAKPREATHGPAPVRPRVRVADATVEALAAILYGLPKGVLHVRDELAGWLLNLQRYSGGSDRPFWLESYVGGPYTVDRQKNPVPLFIPRLALATFGTIQPDRLEDALTGVDDGLAGRFLWTWPDPRPFRRPSQSCDAPAAALCLQRLAGLTMPPGDDGEPRPAYASLDVGAADLLERFGQEMQAAESGATGLLLSSMGKARGQALRLALVLELLRWCANDDGAPEPSKVGLPAMQAAADLMRSYFLPMAARVLGDASVPAEERNARTLAEWVMRKRPAVVNVSSIRDGARLPGLRESDPVKQACRFLADARWLLPPLDTGQPGRPRGDWTVNPLLWAAAA